MQQGQLDPPKGVTSSKTDLDGYLRWVISPRMKRMAAAYSPYPPHGATNSPVLAHRADKVVAACGIETTLTTDKRTEGPLVDSDKPDEQPTRNSHHRSHDLPTPGVHGRPPQDNAILVMVTSYRRQTSPRRPEVAEGSPSERGKPLLQGSITVSGGNPSAGRSAGPIARSTPSGRLVRALHPVWAPPPGRFRSESDGV